MRVTVSLPTTPSGACRNVAACGRFWGKEGTSKPERFEEFRVIRSFALAIGVLAALAPARGHAQTNLDQGKSASQIFAAACVECHKAPGALAKGKSTATVAEFLREHYTTNRDQAASLAAYVTGGRDSIAQPVPGKKAPPERAGASAEGPKPDRHHDQKPSKPEEGTTANAKLRQPAEAEGKPKEEASRIPGIANPIMRPEPGAHDNRPATATRNRRKEPATSEPPISEPATSEPAQEPAALAHAPAVAEPLAARTERPSPEVAPTPTAAAPDEPSTPGEPGEPVPRDNVPD